MRNSNTRTTQEIINVSLAISQLEAHTSGRQCRVQYNRVSCVYFFSIEIAVYLLLL